MLKGKKEWKQNDTNNRQNLIEWFKGLDLIHYKIFLKNGCRMKEMQISIK